MLIFNKIVAGCVRRACETRLEGIYKVKKIHCLVIFVERFVIPFVSVNVTLSFT